jgi:hypothetical protein
VGGILMGTQKIRGIILKTEREMGVGNWNCGMNLEEVG